MHTFEQKQKKTQQTKSVNTMPHRQVFSGQNHAVSFILHLQRTIGNQAVQQLLQSNAEELQTKPIRAGDNNGYVAPSIVHNVLNSTGQPLDAETLAFMEPRFSHNFGQVRVHADENAAESATAVNALAYTVGSHMVFGAGKYAPDTTEGKRLLAHELTHVIQQRHSYANPDMLTIQRRTLRYCSDVRTGDTVMDTLAGILGLEHCWLKTDTKVAGMGPAQAGPLPAWPFGIPTMITDHSADAHTDSREIRGVDENCVDQELQIGKSTGPWGLDNNCNTFVDDVIATCRERLRGRDRHFVSTGTFGIQPVVIADPVNIDAGNKPYFEVRPLPAQHALGFRWIIADSQDRRYLMWGDQGQVFQYGAQYSAYIPSRTRALLRERNIRAATILCRVMGGGA